MNALFSKLHRALAGLGSRSMGVSFPGYSAERRWLGERLRIHGSKQSLEKLAESGWLKGIRDHAEVRSIRDAPMETRHVIARRVQAKAIPRDSAEGWQSAKASAWKKPGIDPGPERETVGFTLCYHPQLQQRSYFQAFHSTKWAVARASSRGVQPIRPQFWSNGALVLTLFLSQPTGLVISTTWSVGLKKGQKNL